MRSRGRKQIRAAAVCCCLAFLIVGSFGVTRYIDTYWLYRGFPAPARPTSVLIGFGHNHHRIQVYSGSVRTITIKSRALGGRAMKVIVYLPPRYNEDVDIRYPVLYLLDGLPGTPVQFINIGDLAVTSDVLLAEHRIRPMIFVMPSGATGFFDDNEWANLVRPDNNWETYVANNLVQTIDDRFRTINRGSSRGIGGLSEGGYGALNIALHHAGEFDLIEGWSAYYRTENSPSLFGNNTKLLDYNSPAFEVIHVATKLRTDHAYIWLYTGNRDRTRKSSVEFANELSTLHIAHSYSEEPGHHNWKLWRMMMTNSLIVASNYFDNSHASS